MNANSQGPCPPASCRWRQCFGRYASLRYLLAPLTVTAAFFGRLGLDPIFGEDHQPFATFFVAIGLTAWFGGLGPTLLCLVLGLAVSTYAIIPPRDSFLLPGPREVAEVLVFLFYGGVTATVVLLLRVVRAFSVVLAAANSVLERRVQQRTNQLREMVAELEHFSYSIVHDMRSPLRAMEGYASFLERRLTAMPQGAGLLEFARRIRLSAHRLDALIRDALSYSKAVRTQLVLRPVDLDPLLRSLIQTYPNLQNQERNIHLTSPLPVVLGNETALTQCFANLLDNAVKFASPERPLQIEVWAEATSSVVRVHVQDNGLGIPKEAHLRLFRMFERLQTDREGTGIGLALVRKVVERMGGRVGVKSEEGQGSCFWVELLAPGPPEQGT